MNYFSKKNSQITHHLEIDINKKTAQIFESIRQMNFIPDQLIRWLTNLGADIAVKSFDSRKIPHYLFIDYQSFYRFLLQLLAQKIMTDIQQAIDTNGSTPHCLRNNNSSSNECRSASQGHQSNNESQHIEESKTKEKKANRPRRSLFSSLPKKKKHPALKGFKDTSTEKMQTEEPEQSNRKSQKQPKQPSELQKVKEDADESISIEQRKTMAKQVWYEFDQEFFREISQAQTFDRIKRVLSFKLSDGDEKNSQKLEEQLARLTGFQFDEIDEALDQLHDQLGSVVQRNNTKLVNLPIELLKNQPCKEILQFDIAKTMNLLHQAEVLRYFVRGFADKTRDVLKRFKKKQNPHKKPTKFIAKEEKNKHQQSQTQCKICFCCEDTYQNCIVYCDGCSTSYHQYCYGLPELPTQEVYKCDVCLWKQSKTNAQKVRCSICKKASFPMKRLGGFFYHITCLVLNNYIQYKDKIIMPRDGVTRHVISQKIYENEVYRFNRESFCQYCTHHAGCKQGMQLTCRWHGCQCSFHPICAYLAGCQFQLSLYWQSGKPFLEVQGFCTNHSTTDRNVKLQTYLRRFTCNFLYVTGKTEEEFYEYYAKQEEVRLKRRSEIIKR